MTNPTHKIDPLKMQDAFHYALTACGGSALGYESAIPLERFQTRTGAMKHAFRDAREAFGVSFNRPPYSIPRTLAGARQLAQAILEAGKAAGYDANGGCKLCRTCNEHQAEHHSGGHCFECVAAVPGLAQALDFWRAQWRVAYARFQTSKAANPDPAQYQVALDILTGRAEPPGVRTAPRSLTVSLTEGDVSNLLHAAEYLGQALAEQAADPTQANAAGHLKRKVEECNALHAKLADLLNPY